MCVCSRVEQAKVDALRGLASIVARVDKKHRKQAFSLCPAVLQVFPPLQQASRDSDARRAVLAATEIAEAAPLFFHSHLSQVRT